MIKFRNRGLLTAGIVAGLGLLATPVVAHHSFAAYDMKSVKTSSGTLKEFRWGAPHSSMVLIYKDKGKDAQMSLVSGSPLMFSKQGFAPKDFKRGDKIKVTYHPNANGAPGGALASLTLSNGRTFSDEEANRASPN